MSNEFASPFHDPDHAELIPNPWPVLHLSQPRYNQHLVGECAEI